jgi:hypothetical protein
MSQGVQNDDPLVVRYPLNRREGHFVIRCTIENRFIHGKSNGKEGWIPYGDKEQKPRVFEYLTWAGPEVTGLALKWIKYEDFHRDPDGWIPLSSNNIDCPMATYSDVAEKNVLGRAHLHDLRGRYPYGHKEHTVQGDSFFRRCFILCEKPVV